MRHLRTFAAVAAAVALMGCQTHGREGSGADGRSAAADQVGLLVGLSSGRTLWIAPQRGAVRLLATKSDLLVPRGDGFWWVGVARRCTVDENDGGGMNVEAGLYLDREDAVYVTRAGEAAHVTLGGMPCEEAETEAAKRAITHARRTAEAAAAEGDSSALQALATDTVPTDGEGRVDDCFVGSRTITFVSPAALSVENRDQTTEYCSPGKYYTSGSNTVRRLTSDEQLPLRPLLAPPEREKLENEFAESAPCGFDDEKTPDHVDSAWAVHRAEGRWVATFWVDGPIVCRGGTDVELSAPLPASFTGHGPLPVPWTEIKRLVPNVTDAAGSPSGAHLALLVGDTLSLVRVREGRIGEAVAKIPLGWSEQIVMLRWASPAEIEQWNRVIPTLAEPEVRVEAPTSP